MIWGWRVHTMKSKLKRPNMQYGHVSLVPLFGVVCLMFGCHLNDAVSSDAVIWVENNSVSYKVSFGIRIGSEAGWIGEISPGQWTGRIIISPGNYPVYLMDEFGRWAIWPGVVVKLESAGGYRLTIYDKLSSKLEYLPDLKTEKIN